MDGTETGWGRPAEPAPRWRALLDRARHGSRAADEPEPSPEGSQPSASQPSGSQPSPSQFGQPLPTRRPYNPLDSRPPQRGFEQHLATYSMRRTRGVWRPDTDWWRGSPPAPAEAGEGFASIGEEQPDWADQLARVTMAAKRVLVRRGLLDITYGLRLAPSLPGAPPPDHNGSHRSTATSNLDQSKSGHKGS